MLISEFFGRWLVFILFGTSFLCMKVWDHEKRQYLGFFYSDVYLGFSAMMLGGGILSWLIGETGVEILETVAIGFLIMVLIPRIYAEIQHKWHHGVFIFNASCRSQSEGESSD